MLVCLLRVAAIADRLEREEERSSVDTVKGLARLEEQVVTYLFLGGVITNVAPVSVTFHIMLREQSTI